MSTLAKVITIGFSVYALIAIVFLISENRRPQATLAWALAFFFMPGLGLLVYLLFGRDWKAFSKRRQLMLQDLKANAYPLLAPMIEGQDRIIARLEAVRFRDSVARLLSPLLASHERCRPVRDERDAAPRTRSVLRSGKAAGISAAPPQARPRARLR